MARKLTQKAIDDLLTRIYGQECHGQISVLHLGKVYNAAAAAYRAFDSPLLAEREAAARVAIRQAFEQWRVKPCQWFAGCTREATTTTPHPTLGDVPTCARCHRFARHQAADPHCTCNDCIQAHAENQEQRT